MITPLVVNICIYIFFPICKDFVNLCYLVMVFFSRFLVGPAGFTFFFWVLFFWPLYYKWKCSWIIHAILSSERLYFIIITRRGNVQIYTSCTLADNCGVSLCTPTHPCKSYFRPLPMPSREKIKSVIPFISIRF